MSNMLPNETPIIIEMTPEGKDGLDGVSVVGFGMVSHVGNVKTYRFTMSNGEHFDFSVADGEGAVLEWGNITGTLTDQTDLAEALTAIRTALASKAETSDVYDKATIDSLLSAIDTAIGQKANADAVYTKTEADALLDGKADTGDSYTKSEDDALLAQKANADDVYTKTETDELLAVKADTGDSYTKDEDDDLLAQKADADDVYTKDETDTLLDGKANIGASYTKSEADTLLSAKADKTDVDAEIDDIDSAIAGIGTALTSKADASDLTALANRVSADEQTIANKADADDVYSKSEVEELIEDAGGLSDDAKQALLQVVAKVAYTDEHGQDYYDALYAALYNTTVIRLNTNTITLNRLGATSQLTATTVPAGGQVTWTSSNPAVATVSANGLVTSVGYGSAVITATSGNVSATCAVAVEQLVAVSLDAVYTQSGRVLDTDSLDTLKTDLVVTVGWSDGTSTVVPSADCVLSGTLAIGTSTVTVAYAGLTDTFSVTVDGLVSIFATYTQSGEVYNTDSLDSLKADLVVTGVYNSGTSTPISDYTLSGTLAVGTSTITVTYLSFTDDFDVVVSVSDVLYKLPQATTFNGTSDYIDTGVALHESDIDYTIMVDFTLPSIPSGTQEVLHCMHEASPYPGTAVETKNTKLRTSVNGALEDNVLSSLTYPATIRVVITHELATGNNTYYRLFGESYKTDVKTSAITPITEDLLLGAYQATDGTKGRYFNGTINRCEVYSSVKSQSAIEHFLGLDAPVQSLAVTYTPSNPVVEGMDLNWLKADMVVTATLTSGVSHTVSPADYTLSGTLAEGTSQVTATYQGVSSSPISVTVGAEGPLYQLPQATTFDGVDDYLDTGLTINSIDRDFTLCLDINQFGRTNNDRDAISLRAYENPYYGMTINCNTSTAIYKSAGKGNVDIYRMYESTHEKFVITHEADSDICTIYRYDSGMNFKAIEAGYNVPNDIAYIVVGARRGRKNTYSCFYDGTINACAIYGRVLVQTEIESYVAPTIYPDSTPTLLYQLPQAATFDGTASSGIAIPEANIVEYDMNYTIMFDAVSSGSGHYVFGISGKLDGTNRLWGLTFWLGDDMAIDGYNKSTKIIQSGTSGKRVKGVITHVKGEEFVTLSYIYDGNPVATAVTVTGAYTPVQRVMTLGAKLNDSGNDFVATADAMTGTIYDFKVYRGLVSQTDIDAYLA